VKILLDESVPEPLSQNLAGHECATVQGCGWAEVTNGELLRRATPEFDLFITCDQNELLSASRVISDSACQCLSFSAF